MLSSVELNKKVRQYEEFANDVLKVDLQKSVEQKAKYEKELQEFVDLENNLKLLQQVSSSLGILACMHAGHGHGQAGTCIHMTFT